MKQLAEIVFMRLLSGFVVAVFMHWLGYGIITILIVCGLTGMLIGVVEGWNESDD